MAFGHVFVTHGVCVCVLFFGESTLGWLRENVFVTHGARVVFRGSHRGLASGNQVLRKLSFEMVMGVSVYEARCLFWGRFKKKPPFGRSPVLRHPHGGNPAFDMAAGVVLMGLPC